MFSKDIIDRFWLRVSKDGPTMPHMDTPCWAWTGLKVKKGYGVLNPRGKTTAAHRISWMIHFGDIPQGIFVCHRCDNPECANPDHLFLGTNADNMIDAYSKGRVAAPKVPGEKNGRAKLTESDVARIREMRAQGMKLNDIAHQIGVGRHCIGLVLNSRRWKHVQ